VHWCSLDSQVGKLASSCFVCTRLPILNHGKMKISYITTVNSIHHIRQRLRHDSGGEILDSYSPQNQTTAHFNS
jgi:hypothetical protein